MDHQEQKYIKKPRNLQSAIDMNWLEFLQSCIFLLNYRYGRSNMVVDALRKSTTLLTTVTVEMVGIEEMRVLYEMDIYFFEA